MIGLTTAFLFGGLALASLAEMTSADSEKALLWAKTSPWLFLGITLPFAVLEGLAFTVGCIELGRSFLKSLWTGALVGIIAYGPLLHCSGGPFSIATASWIALVLNASYVLLRSRSRRVAVLSTIGHKIAFILYAAGVLYLSAAG